MSNKIFKAKGTVEEIGKKVLLGDLFYMPLKIKMELSTQVLDFYLIHNSRTPPPFKLIDNYFGVYNSYKIGENIEFDFNIVYNPKGMYKLRIISIYNKKSNVLENGNK